MNKFKKGDSVVHNVLGKAPTPNSSKGLVDYYLPDGRVMVQWGNMGALDYPEANLTLLEKAETVENNAEMVAHPNHYGGDTTYEVIKVIEAWGLDNDAFLFNVIKYTARAGKKGKQLEDLKKAEFYLKRRIASLEESNA